MASTWEDRWLIVLPAASINTARTWWVNNIDPGTNAAAQFSVSLNATGRMADAATHYVACTAFTRALAFKFVKRLCALAGIAEPAAWETWTKAQRLQWLQDQRPTIVANTGIRYWRSDNDGLWDDFQARLTAAGLKIRGTVTP